MGLSDPGRTRRTPAFVAIAALAIAGTAGCASSPASSNGSQSLMSPKQAAAYADTILRDTVNAVTPRPSLEFYEGDSTLDGACLDGPDASKLVVVNRDYTLRGITGRDFATIGDQVLAYWKHLGWVITSTNGIGESTPSITAVAPPYAFSVSLNWDEAIGNPEGELSIAASSVCLPPHETPSSS